MLSKNQNIELLIEDIAHDGSGVGHADSIAVFVPNTVVGDFICAKIVKVASRCCYGIVEELLTPSPVRCAPDCPAFPRCGGCSLRQMTYEAELRLKSGWVRENMRRIGKLSVVEDEALPSPLVERYRNKAIYPIVKVDGRAVIGFYVKRSHRIVACEDCRLHPEVFSALTDAVRRWIDRTGVSVYDEEAHCGLLRAFFLRRGEETGEVMACIVANGRKLPDEEGLVKSLRSVCPALCSVVLNVNTAKTNVVLGGECRTLWGKDTIDDILCGLRFSLSPLSFYQVNRQGAEALYRVAAEYADPKKDEVLVDLYCGTGTIGLSMAKRVKELIGVEIVAPAIENAKKNAAANGVENARFLCADAAEAARQLESEGVRPDVVIVDPPRRGLESDLVETIARMAPSRVVYVSCNSATAARDAALFAQQGYKATRVRAVDMFPRTAHIECVLKFERLTIKSQASNGGC